MSSISVYKFIYVWQNEVFPTKSSKLGFLGIGVPSSLPAAQAGDGFHQGYVASPL